MSTGTGLTWKERRTLRRRVGKFNRKRQAKIAHFQIRYRIDSQGRPIDDAGRSGVAPWEDLPDHNGNSPASDQA